MNKPKTPPFRKIKGYAFDPSLSARVDTSLINDMVYKVPWEKNLKAGPVGEYVEIVDYDPTLAKFYTPVNLNEPELLAQDGLSPSESNPQFHQQMVYAVVMTTIRNFEKALGRKILWSPHLKKVQSAVNDDEPDKLEEEPVYKLRIYPHGLRDANAYYSPQKKALLFGYFAAKPADITLQMPGEMVFTCLSHDIIAHETTHAILDGLHRRFTEPTNPDVLAFHEAFADVVALFQHFTFPEVLKSQIAKTKGNLEAQNLLGELAQQFGTAVGSYGALRSAIGYTNQAGEWTPLKPNGDEYRTVMEPHARGAILVAAVFDAFLTIYKTRITDLLRIATGGTGVLSPGEIHPDLVNRLAAEAAKTANHILTMCIRAIDYCPPIDITFGDYLRAIITADTDLVVDDTRNYRVAFIEAFRERGIYPQGIRNLSVDSLCYAAPDTGKLGGKIVRICKKYLRDYRHALLYKPSSTESERQHIYETTRLFITGGEWNGERIDGIHRKIVENFENAAEFEQITGLIFANGWEELGIKTAFPKGPTFEVHSLRLASRVGPTDQQSNQVIVFITQKVGVDIKKYIAGELQFETFVPGPGKETDNSFILRGGCAMVFDLDSDIELKYAISKPLLDMEALKTGVRKINADRVANLYQAYRGRQPESEYEAYFSKREFNPFNEPFSFLHKH